MTAINPESALHYARPEAAGLDSAELQEEGILDAGTGPWPESEWGKVSDINEIRNLINEAYEQPAAEPAEIIDIETGLAIPPKQALAGKAVEEVDIFADRMQPLDVKAVPGTKKAPIEMMRQAAGRVAGAVGEWRSSPKIVVRDATTDDIDTMVSVDMKAFERVYASYGMSDEELRADLRAKFEQRYQKVGGEWIQLIETDGECVGFMMCCPTSKSPEEFTSWEETTDGGTLETTYDPDGDNIYVVSLSMLPKGSKINGQDALITRAIGQAIERGYEQSYFESRLPGLRTWVRIQCRREGLSIDELSPGDLQDMAQQYFGLTVEINGREVPRDPLIRMYSEVGCEFVKVVPNAYEDRPSMNFGAVGVYKNPIPDVIRRSRLARKAVGRAVQFMAQYPILTKMVF